MLSRLCNTIPYLLVLFTCFSIGSSKNANITIPLNKTITLANKELYGDFLNITSNSTVYINLVNNNNNISYIIFQVHSHLHNITLNYNNTRVYGSTISGTNVGLYSSVKNLDTFSIDNANMMDLKLYISVHGYRDKDPIPGGGNHEFSICISPFMQAKYTKDYITVDVAPVPSSTAAYLKFYRLYLPERNFDADSYFTALRNMLTLDKIRENADELYERNQFPPPLNRRYMSAYPGVGAIYVAVAYDKNNDNLYGVYVPISTYACDPLEEDSCYLLDDISTQFFCAVLLFVGLFTCYFGHRFFKTEMFLAGMFFGVILTYVLMSLMQEMKTPALVWASVLSGAFFGAIWLLFWWFYGIPVLAVLIPTLHLGFLLSSIIYYRLPAGQFLLENDTNFWSFFLLVMILTSVTLVTAAYVSNIVCCAVLGAYAAVFSIDHYLGSSLKYIVINTIRRAVVEKFRFAELSPPFQWRDIIVTLLWVGLAVSGVLVQYYHNRSRPPFPPPPRSINYTGPELRPNRNRRYGAIDGGEDAMQPSASNRQRPITTNSTAPLLG